MNNNYNVSNNSKKNTILTVLFTILIGVMIFVIFGNEKSMKEKTNFLNISKQIYSKVENLDLEEDIEYEIKDGSFIGENKLNIDNTIPQNGIIKIKDNMIAVVFYDDKFCAIKGYDDYSITLREKEYCTSEKDTILSQVIDYNYDEDKFYDNLGKAEDKDQFIKEEIEKVPNKIIKIKEIIEEEIKIYSVTFDLDNGSENVVKKVEIGKSILPIETPIKAGYKFLGWYKDNIYFDFSSLIFNDIMLKAKWEKVENITNTVVPTKDITNPSVPTIQVYESWTNMVQVSGTISGSKDEESGIKKYEYSMSGASNIGWTSESTFIVSKAGVTTIKARAINGENLYSDIVSKTVRIDREIPTCKVYKYKYGDLNNDNILDILDLVLIIEYISGDTKASLTQLYQSDLSKNGKIDQEDLTILQNAIVNNNNFDSMGVVIELNSFDSGGSGLKESSTKVIPNESLNKEYQIYDYAGNKGVCSVQSTINSDTTKPSTPNVTVLETWTNSNVSGSIYGSVDKESGILRYEYSMTGDTSKDWTSGNNFLVSNEGVTTINVRAINEKGLISSSKTATVRIDKTSPTCSTTKYKYGDPTNDGEIDIMDSVACIDIVGTTNTNRGLISCQCDVANGNNLIDEADISAITDAIVNDTNFDIYGKIVYLSRSDLGGSGIKASGDIFDGLNYAIYRQSITNKTYIVSDNAGNSVSCSVTIP